MGDSAIYRVGIISIAILSVTLAFGQSLKHKVGRVDTLTTSKVYFASGGQQTSAYQAPQKTLYVSPSFIEDATHYNTIQAAVSAASSGDKVFVSAGTYAFGHSDSVKISVSRITIQFDKEARLSGGRTYPPSAFSSTYNYPTFIIDADSVTIDGMNFAARDSISAVIRIRSKKHFTLKNSVITTDIGDGSLIKSDGGKNYFSNNRLIHNIGINYENTFSVYSFNNVQDQNSARDTLYDDGSYWESGEYCYGGTVNGDAWITNTTMWSKSNPIGGNCLNLYAGSRVWISNCSLYGRVSASTTNFSGKPIITKISNSYLEGDKIHGTDFIYSDCDSTWIENCTIKLTTSRTTNDARLSAGPFNMRNGYLNLSHNSIIGLPDTNGNHDWFIGSLADVSDSSHYVLNDNTIENVYLDFLPRPTGRIWLEADGLKMTGKISHTNPNLTSFSLWGMDTRSYLRNCVFVNDSSPNAYIGYNPYAAAQGYGDGGYVASDSAIEFTNVHWGGSSNRTDLGTLSEIFKIGVNAVFNKCSWDYSTNSTTNTLDVGVLNGATVTFNDCVLKTTATAVISSADTLIPNIRLSYTTLIPNSMVGVSATYLNYVAEPAILPTSFDDLQLWLRADNVSTRGGDSVISWSDKSGLSNDFSYTLKPPIRQTGILSGQPVVHFSLADSTYINSGTTISDTNFTLFVLARIDTVNDTGGGRILGQANTPNSGVNIGATGEYGHTLGSYYITAFADAETKGSGSSDSIEQAYGGWELFEVHRTGRNVRFYLNGQNQGADTLGTALATDSMAWSTIAFFAPFTGDVADLFLYRSDLDETTSNLLRKYIGDRYGVFTMTAGDHKVTGTLTADSVATRALTSSGTSILNALKIGGAGYARLDSSVWVVDTLYVYSEGKLVKLRP
jgi:hypothetical protein